LEITVVSMHPQPIGPIPEDTSRVARAAFPKGNDYIEMRNVLGTIYDDEDFAELFEVRGRPAIAPWRLALVTVMQFSEGLSDRQAAEAVRARIDWKYALGLQLTDPGFNFSVLSEFRSRLVEGGKERLLLEKLLEGCKQRGYLKARGRQRTDSTHVLGALRLLSKWERTAETRRAALNALASADPEWLTEHADPQWFERYGRCIEDQRLPKGKEAREEYLKTVGADGIRLLAHLTTAATATDGKQLAAIQQRLTATGVLPAQQLADSSYVCGSNLVFSHARQIDLIGPAYKDNTWQAKADEGFDVAKFRIDWKKQTVTCPHKRQSIRWSKTKTARGRKMIHVEFAPGDCAACPSRPKCTRAKNLPRALTLQPRALGYPDCQSAPEERRVC
jgi:transposase